MLFREPADALAQIAPQGVGQAAIAALTAFFALAPGCIYRFIDGSDDSANGDLTRVFTQQITTAGPRTLATRPFLRRRENNCSR